MPLEVLVIDDRADRREALAAYLSKVGPVTKARNAKSGLARFGKLMPDVVVVRHDLGVAEGGPALCMELRRHRWGPECLLVIIGAPIPSIGDFREKWPVDVVLPVNFIMKGLIESIGDYAAAAAAGRRYELNLTPGRGAGARSAGPADGMSPTRTEVRLGTERQAKPQAGGWRRFCPRWRSSGSSRPTTDD